MAEEGRPRPMHAELQPQHLFGHLSTLVSLDHSFVDLCGFGKTQNSNERYRPASERF